MNDKEWKRMKKNEKEWKRMKKNEGIVAVLQKKKIKE